jgi:hypothetical protein
MAITTYLWGNSPWYSVDRKMGVPQSQSGCCGEEKNPLPLLGIESSFFSHPALP